MSSDESAEEHDDLRAVSGALRYAFGVSDSLTLKLYAVVFLLATAFVTILWILAEITWLGRLQGVRPTSRTWGILPFLAVIYLAVEGVLFAPLYLPMRRYRSRRRAEMAEKATEAQDEEGAEDDIDEAADGEGPRAD